jgi:L-seryl-tRNA(Ser) seleniumtransferase
MEPLLSHHLRQLPSVDRLLQSDRLTVLAADHGHALVVEAARTALDAARAAIRAGESLPDLNQLVDATVVQLSLAIRPGLRPAINATGVIIHTNLGRAPLSQAALAAMAAIGQGYSNLEYDLETGQRGSRYHHAEALLKRLTGAEAALMVNNNAAAVLLILSVLARDRDVVISRGQLVEIGGGFRIPDVMRQSGARLVEVGTTNRTYRRDYQAAITDQTALLMRVHYSNFRQIGFIHETPLEELVELGRARGIPVVDDLGSGSLLDTAAYGLAHEPMPQESLAAGADLVSFSGDKLLGGPQAGVIVGRVDLVAELRDFPLTRALRVDKLTLAGLQATLLHYLRDEAPRQVPVWRMIAIPLAELDARARRWATRLAGQGVAAEVIDGASTVGGGSLPGETLPTRLVALRVVSPDDLARRLRLAEPPVVARIEHDRLVLDPRTVLPEQDEDLIRQLIDRIRLEGRGSGNQAIRQSGNQGIRDQAIRQSGIRQSGNREKS